MRLCSHRHIFADHGRDYWELQFWCFCLRRSFTLNFRNSAILRLLVCVPGRLLLSAAVTLGRVALNLEKGFDSGKIHAKPGREHHKIKPIHTLTPKSTHLRKFLHPLHHLIFIPLGFTTQIATSQLLQTPLFCLGMGNSASSHMTQFP